MEGRGGRSDARRDHMDQGTGTKLTTDGGKKPAEQTFPVRGTVVVLSICVRSTLASDEAPPFASRPIASPPFGDW
jgi:hypothetical protein